MRILAAAPTWSPHSTQHHQHAVVLEAVKVRPRVGGICGKVGATVDLDSFSARRLQRAAVGTRESLRRGRTRERDRGERKCASSRRFALASRKAIREQRKRPKCPEKSLQRRSRLENGKMRSRPNEKMDLGFDPTERFLDFALCESHGTARRRISTRARRRFRQSQGKDVPVGDDGA